MLNNLFEDLEQNGVDVKKTIERFMGNEELYEKFLYKFLQDDNFEKTKQKLIDKDYIEACKYAHTLKGVAANLGFLQLFSTLEKMVNILRSGNYDGIEELLTELEDKYIKLYGVILKHKD